jgi:hypothetical protein
VFDLPENFTRQERTLLAGNDMPDQSSSGDLEVQIDGLAKSGYDDTPAGGVLAEDCRGRHTRW